MICKCSFPYLRLLLDSAASFTGQSHLHRYNPTCKCSLELSILSESQYTNNTSLTLLSSKLQHSFRSYVYSFPIIVSNPFIVYFCECYDGKFRFHSSMGRH